MFTGKLMANVKWFETPKAGVTYKSENVKITVPYSAAQRRAIMARREAAIKAATTPIAG
jgi:hypothetical protein